MAAVALSYPPMTRRFQFSLAVLVVRRRRDERNETLTVVPLLNPLLPEYLPDGTSLDDVTLDLRSGEWRRISP